MMDHGCNEQQPIHRCYLKDDPEFLQMAIRQQKAMCIKLGFLQPVTGFCNDEWPYNTGLT
jgi:hypothetical protein